MKFDIRLAEGNDFRDRCNTARNSWNLAVLEKLSEDMHPWVREAVAENPVTSIAILKKLSMDREGCVRIAADRELDFRYKFQQFYF